ncbi:type I restriction modification DNA specificity domain protein [Escherichia coli 99.0741]|nr:type I restriction modification DNA specificity domain protein [Escherichia coli 99.0741]
MSGMKVCHCSFPDSVPVLRPASTQERTIAGWINRASVDECNIYPAGALFVSTNGEGSHSYSYVSSFEFVCNSDISVLIPKKDMGLFEKIYYSRCITMNRYLFSYGRKPKGKRLKHIELPDIIPDWVMNLSASMNEVRDGFELLMSGNVQGFNICCRHGNNYPEQKLIPLSELFDVNYGLNLELNKLEKDSSGINFVSRTSKNNGVSARVKLIDGISPLPAGVLTVAAGGSVMETFVQDSPFYSGRDLYWLRPKFELTLEEKLYYCSCIRRNRHKYSYGRQANRTLKNLLVPSLDSVPAWVYGVTGKIISELSES